MKIGNKNENFMCFKKTRKNHRVIRLLNFLFFLYKIKSYYKLIIEKVEPVLNFLYKEFKDSENFVKF